MIFVGGVPFSSSSQGNTLVALMEDPILVSAANSFKAIPEGKFSVYEESGMDRLTKNKSVYLFQREYGTVDPAFVDFVGTDEATTCVGIVIRNKKNGMTSVSHMDSPNIVDMGLSQMLLHVVDHNMDAELDVHLVGGFEDVSPNVCMLTLALDQKARDSWMVIPLCAKIVEALFTRPENFHVQTLFVLGHNTRRDSEGNAYPIFHGLVVETSTGLVTPACFDRTSRCPDEIVRKIRVTSAYEDPSWSGKLLETYDTQTDQFRIASCCWSFRQKYISLTLQSLSDSEILLRCSTSPSAEAPDFVDNLRRKWEYLIEHPDWRETFPRKQPQVFERTGDGGWKRC